MSIQVLVRASVGYTISRLEGILGSKNLPSNLFCGGSTTHCQHAVQVLGLENVVHDSVAFFGCGGGLGWAVLFAFTAAVGTGGVGTAASVLVGCGCIGGSIVSAAGLTTLSGVIMG